ncbi:MAG: sporulation integral membrane protein YlbJ [Firmicutes bacterium]|nr:sporulation integral membrane protein YlbJ [Bacillota bacterium]
MRFPQRPKKYLITYLGAAVAIWLTIAMIRFPEKAFEAAGHGLKVWFEIVFPALLPFFIGAEILMGLGVVHFMGVLLEPFMRPLFNVPGAGSFVLAMGLASGYPIGAVLTARLRKQNLCTQTEAERLVSFTNTADPLFMIGAVGVGMFGLVEVGNIITITHYLAALITGLVLRFYAPYSPTSPQLGVEHTNMLVRAFRALYKARQEDGRPFGGLLGDAIREAINTMLAIGGFIILFSVITQMAAVMGVTSYLGRLGGTILATCGLNENLAPSLISGFFEITIGSDYVASAVDAAGNLLPLGERIVVAAAIIGWSGLSVHFQVAAMVNETDIRMLPYVVARVLHALLSGLVAYLIIPSLINVAGPLVVPAFAAGSQGAVLSYWRWRLLHLGLYPLLLLLGLGLINSILSHPRPRNWPFFFPRR